MVVRVWDTYVDSSHCRDQGIQGSHHTLTLPPSSLSPPVTTTSSRSTLTQGDAVRTTSVTSGSLGVSVGWQSTTGNSLMVSLAHHATRWCWQRW